MESRYEEDYIFVKSSKQGIPKNEVSRAENSIMISGCAPLGWTRSPNITVELV
jgi:hypothetical protein